MLPIDRLRPPLPEWQIRDKNPFILQEVLESMKANFDINVVNIVAIMLRDPKYNTPVDYAAVEFQGLRTLENTCDGFVFHCAGGNHTRMAAELLRLENPNDNRFKRLPVTVYKHMDPVHAVRLGAVHQKITHAGRANSQLDIALLCIKRARLFMQDPEAYDEKDVTTHLHACLAGGLMVCLGGPAGLGWLAGMAGLGQLCEADGLPALGHTMCRAVGPL